MQHELGVIGAGNMAEAIVRGGIDAGVIKPDAIIVADPSSERCAAFEAMGVAIGQSNSQVIAESNQLMLAVKPQIYPKVEPDLAGVDAEKQIILSIMTGISIARLEQAAGGEDSGARVVRIMPNTPLLVGEGMSAICVGPNAQVGDELLTLQILNAAGEAIVIDEAQMDAVTVVSGSGPAYLFYLAEAMTDAAVQLGLSAEHAKLLVEQTLRGSAKLMAESDDDPRELRRKVTSPGGTTQAACEHLDASEVKRHIIDAIAKAEARSKELGK